MAPVQKEDCILLNGDSTDSSIIDGRILANPAPGEEVCITGLSGIYPNSRNVEEFRDNLMNKQDLVDGDFRRWRSENPEIPQRTGKIYDVNKYDAGFFGVHRRQADSMDPMCRLVMERTIEAIYDAGFHPSELEGTNTGVFVGACFSESERDWFLVNLTPQSFAITGCVRTFIPHRISYYLKLKGPSMVLDTACSSSSFALENAYRAIRTGVCDMAIVAGCNLTLHPLVSLQFSRLGVLSREGMCRSFDADAKGYVRSEATSVIILQKAKDSRRIYSRILHSKTNCDGHKEQGIHYPSGEIQKELLMDFYKECDVDPRSLSYMEAHGTGTKVGDPEECKAIDDIFCNEREGPLLLGSVKSNIGHTEPASGLCSVTKAIIAMEEEHIPPNINYSKPRSDIKALEEGRLKVVTERMPFQDDNGLIAVNSFGFGGANSHVLLKWNTKLKVNGGQPKDDLPRLVCVSGRTAESITALTKDVNSRKLDAEYIQLLHEVFKKDIHPHPYRGYTIVSKKGEIKSSMKNFDGLKPHLVLAFGSFEDSWQSMTKSLLAFPVFSATIQKIHHVLYRADSHINIMEIINDRATNVHPVVKNILGNITLHIGIVEILKDLKLVPDFIVGYALGELSCAYFDGSLSLDQSVLLALEIADNLKTMNEPSSTVFVTGPESQIRKLTPAEVEIIWKNDGESVVLSGHPNIIQNVVETLQNEGFAVKHIHSASVTWLSGTYSKIALEKMKKIIPEPKKRSRRWLSASLEEFASATYFLDAVSSGINFPDMSNHFRNDPIMFELGLGAFSELLKNTVGQPIEVMKFEDDAKNDGVIILLDMLGRLYEFGYNPQIQNLYPRIQYPVGRGTPMISPKIKWNHSQDHYVMHFKEKTWQGEQRPVHVSLTSPDCQSLAGHVIDGRILYPATAYLTSVWSIYVVLNGIAEYEKTVAFEDCRFKRATTISKEWTDFYIRIQRHSGKFEMLESNTAVVTGRVYFMTDDETNEDHLTLPLDDRKADTIPMKNKDVYKELQLRGYNYKGVFRGIEECNQDATVGWVKWDENWISFMDNMLQIKILQMDTRNLYVPTGFKKVIINARKHIEYARSFGENPVLPVYVYKDVDVIKCGGIEIQGLMASPIPRRKQLGEPVLEKYEFVPNDLKFVSPEQSIRIISQIGLENNYGIKIKVVEFIDEATDKNSEPLAPLVHKVFSDQPLIQTKIILLSEENLTLENVSVENKKLESETDCNLIIGSKILKRGSVLHQVFEALKGEAFILSREDPDFEFSSMNHGDLASIDILTVHQLASEKLVYFRRKVDTKECKIINVSRKDEVFSWLPPLQLALKNDGHVLIYSQNEDDTGVLGLFNCIRREPGGMNVRCFIILDENAPTFDTKHPFYATQMRKNMCVNIYKNGQWGTYRHLLLNQVEKIETEHCYVSSTIKGDLSSLKWIEGNLNSKSVLPPEKTLVQVYYSAMNFRDVMTASGRINADVITSDRTKQECVQGIEFSGRTSSGRRVMGLATFGALSTIIAADSYLLWDVPDCWSLKEAASVPVVYGTVLYALVVVGKLRKGQSILIHSGTGGVGQAAINIASSYGCTVYTTVGTNEKREAIKKLFPQLTDSHIGNSRDSSFEQLVMQGTRGRGVDMVLNSLAEEKLLASVRCLAKGGKFMEIGKFDLASNNSLALLLLSKGCSFHGVMLDRLLDAHPMLKKKLNRLIIKGVKNGAIRPLKANVFEKNEVEQAFRFMASGKHMGKVMIQVRKEEPSQQAIPSVITSTAQPRFHCTGEKSYVIIGGLGGFGLELADWLVLRGATKLLLTSRNGIKTGYQTYRINLWKSYGVEVRISTADITTKEGCDQLISEAQDLGPVDTIFNLAVVLKDCVLENQSPESFNVSFGPKATATRYLDEITRIRCPDLSNFVVFSSVSCGRGNAGQTNYGMANSIMERICEKRRRDGFPALAIEWGAIGDVGLVAEMMEDHTEIEIGGTLQQRISSCLEVMDVFLRQTEAAVVSSMVVAMKRSGGGGADNMLDAVLEILGIKKHTVSPQTTFAELGMDSMSAVEVNQTLERDFEVFLTAQDIRNMTLTKLEEIQRSREEAKSVDTVKKREATGIELIMKYAGSEAKMNPILNLPSLCGNDPNAPNVFCFPGVEGYVVLLQPLSMNLRANVIGIQFPFDNPKKSFLDMAKEAMKHIEKRLEPNAPVNIVAHSWGSVIALETIALLEKKGITANMISLDGSPAFIKDLCENSFSAESDAELETKCICHLLGFFIPLDSIYQNKERIYRCQNFEERMEVFQEITKDTVHSPKYKRNMVEAFITRTKELKAYSPNYPKIKSTVRLFKPTTLSLKNPSEDYGLSDLCTDLREIKTFEGNHVTILENPDVAHAINGVFGLNSSLSAKIRVGESIKAHNGIATNGN